jgi:2'-hydroxyisoflavone reductase
VYAVESRINGTFNATGVPVPMSDVIETGTQASGSDAQPIWVDESFLLAQGVAPWSDLPLWATAEDAGIHAVDIARALRAGLRIRPLIETVRDTLTWTREAPTVPSSARHGRAGMAPARERELLDAWHGRR